MSTGPHPHAYALDDWSAVLDELSSSVSDGTIAEPDAVRWLQAMAASPHADQTDGWVAYFLGQHPEWVQVQALKDGVPRPALALVPEPAPVPVPVPGASPAAATDAQAAAGAGADADAEAAPPTKRPRSEVSGRTIALVAVVVAVVAIAVGVLLPKLLGGDDGPVEPPTASSTTPTTDSTLQFSTPSPLPPTSSSSSSPGETVAAPATATDEDAAAPATEPPSGGLDAVDGAVPTAAKPGAVPKKPASTSPALPTTGAAAKPAASTPAAGTGSTAKPATPKPAASGNSKPYPAALTSRLVADCEAQKLGKGDDYCGKVVDCLQETTPPEKAAKLTADTPDLAGKYEAVLTLCDIG